MRGLIPVYVVAMVAWRAGRRYGKTEGEISGLGKASAYYASGLLDGRALGPRRGRRS
ncbi:hypothetical protein [Nocardioides sp.]|uniref:hypothetical protein n=1 Tax=Nocardioides sp. TaxID=35761 RepID=UPI002CDCC018|nr:hypothetical protein [Nocardioides sp.]HSX68119.1 hypothetical protein [Nocardioides sp.]